MLRNVLDIDFSAQKISLTSSKGALLLFDFRAAFPSMSHDFMWDVLEGIGIPSQYVRALQLFSRNNKHMMNIQGLMVDSISVKSGVRQGCPLSPLLFALCVDCLLQEIDSMLSGHEIVRAFADDTAAVVGDYTIALAALQKLSVSLKQFMV